MSTQSTVISVDQLGQDFPGLFKHRAFRLLALDYYDAENEHAPYARFLAGDEVDPAWRRPWQGVIRGARATTGAVVQRVHVVTEPASSYVRFMLLHAYPANADAGEDVRILSRAQAGGLTLAGDFWLFDNRLAAFLTYDDTGRATQVELNDNPPLIVSLLGIQHEALRLAAPVARYVAEHNITEGKHAA